MGQPSTQNFSSLCPETSRVKGSKKQAASTTRETFSSVGRKRTRDVGFGVYADTQSGRKANIAVSSGPGNPARFDLACGRGSSSSRYTRAPSPPVPLGTPFEKEIGVGAHDMDYVEAQKNYGIEEENEVDAVNLDEDNENIAKTPTVGDTNVRSESINLPHRPPSAPRPRKRTSIA
ncbi:hypothetical protein FXO37_22150 [Capsicum annuum]|nr:hypothetical protein FXO37_22150 [Capsicum annuum]